MAKSRLELQQLLKEIVGEGVSVYFQAPPTNGMVYPAIVYNRDLTDTGFANNVPYRRDKRYQLTVMDKNPDSEIPDKIGQLPQCIHQRWFAADGLNHDVFVIYF
jgi:hypothetical protein